MYLRTIEMTGFKSFAQKTTLQFHDGITGIVGPNGSGKSNVADALRWVLGEQSTRQLRSVNMQDVIFTGTQYRKKAGCASVKITFDNTDHSLPIDYEEVVICRRVYQTGENEYLLNHSVCRLKDIRELFYDTGIGQEGYSIIGQGQIEQILSNRPEDRRELLDEAVGIVRYRKRKQEAIRKLQKEQQNVDRIADILNELENQRKPLAQQAKIAKQYLTLQEKLKLYEINLYLKNTAEMDARKCVLTQKLEVVQSEMQDLKQKIYICRQTQEATEQTVAATEEQIADLHRNQQKITDGRQELEVHYRVLEEQIRTDDSQIQRNQSRQKSILKIQSQLAIQQEELRKQQHQWKQKQTEQEQEYQQASLLEKALEKDVEQIEEQTFYQGHFLEENLDYQTLQSRFQNLEQEERDTQKKLHMLQARHEALSNIVERYEGYGYAVKQLMETKHQFFGIHGTVAQLVQTEPAYELAIETALGAALQNIIVDTEYTAKDCIDYLKNYRYGRATFLPLTTVQAKQTFSNQQALQEAGVVGIGSTLVHTQEKYNSVIQYLLGKVLVVKTLDEALRIAKKYHYSFRIVTLSGEQLNIGGSVSGGAYKQNSNLLGRQRELDTMQSRLQDLQKRCQTLKEQKKEVHDDLQQLRIQAAQAAKSLESRQREVRRQLDEARRDVAKKQLELQRIIQQQQLLTQQQEQMKRQSQELGIELQQLQAEIQILQKKKADRHERVQQARQKLEQAKQQLEKLKGQLSKEHERKNDAAKKQREILHCREELQEQSSNLDKEKLRLEQQMDYLQENLEQEIQHLWTAYEMTPSETESYRQKELQNAQLSSLTTKIKQQIRGLGSVNVNAVEEYAQLEERYTFLSGQYQDLELAKKQLKQLISELDQGMRKQFSDSFGKINQSFEKVFQELFGGGHASLTLMAEEGRDILEAGIQVIAQPPGKKLQNLMQMSGGEKALTAISLLFAIQRLKPTPFCLLDEIEAALDDANIGRFAEYLIKLKKETQFIVITHRKGTMMATDQLYGVTMQEKGISSLVSVKLEEAE